MPKTLNFKEYFFFIAFAILMFSNFGCNSFFRGGIMNKGVLEEKDFVKEVSFETRLGLAIVPVKIDGSDYQFLFDTGAPNVISEEVQKKFKFKSLGNQSIRDSEGQSNKVKYIELKNLEIGGINFSNTAAFVADLKANPAIECLGIDGIIGSNLMRFCTWRVDFVDEMITLTDHSEQLEYSSNYHEIPFKSNTQHAIKIDFKTPNATITNIKIDYGSNSSIGVPNKVYNVLKEKGDLRDTKLEVGYSQSGLFGDFLVDTTASSIADFGRFGEIKTGNIEIESSGKGLLGTSILKNYLVTMNWKNKTIGFDSLTEDIDLQRNRFGFSPAFRDGNTIVKSIVIDSPASKAGIKPGMIIQKIDGVSVKGMDGFCNYILKEKTNKDSVSLQIEMNGVLKDLELIAENETLN